MSVKICFFSRSAYPLFNPLCKATFGGAEVDLYLISKEIAKDRLFECHFITGDFGQKNLEKISNVTLHKSYKFEDNKLIQIFKLIKKIITVNADVYVQEGASAGTGVICFICKLLGKKFVYRTASDIDCNGVFIKDNYIEGLLYKFGIKNASLVITQNFENKTQLKNNFNIESIVIKNAIEIPNKYINIKNKEYVLWVGRSETLKQPELFLKLASKISLTKFIIICPKANYNSVNIEELNKKAKEIPNVEFINSVPFDEIGKYFERAKIFVNTSKYEGFPNTFVQSAANSVAIFSLNVNPDNFIVNEKCGFFANGDFDLLQKKIIETLEDETKLVDYSNNSLAYAKRNFDIFKIVEQYKENILENLKK